MHGSLARAGQGVGPHTTQQHAGGAERSLPQTLPQKPASPRRGKSPAARGFYSSITATHTATHISLTHTAHITHLTHSSHTPHTLHSHTAHTHLTHTAPHTHITHTVSDTSHTLITHLLPHTSHTLLTVCSCPLCAPLHDLPSLFRRLDRPHCLSENPAVRAVAVSSSCLVCVICANAAGECLKPSAS